MTRLANLDSDDKKTEVVGSERVLAVLVELAAHTNGARLEELALALHSPKPTVHRALASLRKSGLVDRPARGEYILGDEFLRLAFEHHRNRPDAVRARPVLEELVSRFGETAHYAVLDDRDVVYRAKEDPTVGALRLTSTVGGRNPAHCTGVGKLLLSYVLHSVDDVVRWAGGNRLQARTPTTITTAEGLHHDLQRIREVGYALDREESEPGVNCLAVAAYFDSGERPSGAVSVSALTLRTGIEELVNAHPDIARIVNSAGLR